MNHQEHMEREQEKLNKKNNASNKSEVGFEQQVIPILPDDVNEFIRQITLKLQCSADMTEEEISTQFYKAIKLYNKYDVEKLRQNSE